LAPEQRFERVLGEIGKPFSVKKSAALSRVRFGAGSGRFVEESGMKGISWPESCAVKFIIRTNKGVLRPLLNERNLLLENDDSDAVDEHLCARAPRRLDFAPPELEFSGDCAPSGLNLSASKNLPGKNFCPTANTARHTPLENEAAGLYIAFRVSMKLCGRRGSKLCADASPERKRKIVPPHGGRAHERLDLGEDHLDLADASRRKESP
jgi:hypothetical protein